MWLLKFHLFFSLGCYIITMFLLFCGYRNIVKNGFKKLGFKIAPIGRLIMSFIPGINIMQCIIVLCMVFDI